MTKHGTDAEAWVSRGERGATIAIKIIVWIALHLGRATTRLLLYPICLYFLVFSKSSREASYNYLRRARGGNPGLADRFRHYHTFAACILDRVYLLNNEVELFEIEVENEAIAKAELARGTGCFLFGAHLGSFEILRTLGHRQPGLKLSLLMYEENARKINSVLNAINPDLSLEVIALGQSDSMLAVERRLDEGHFVSVLADRALSLGEGEYLSVPFLGDPARFPLGPFRLAAVLRRPILFMVGLYRGGRRYEVHFERLVDFTDLPRDARPDEIEQAVRHYVSRIEHYCRLAPYNWFNFYDFWK